MSCPALIPSARPGLSGPLIAVVMDGVGLGDGGAGDAVAKARTPNLDRFLAQPLSGRLRAHGMAVGMPGDGDMGNSEVGHNALGAGRIFDQGAKRVAEAVSGGELFAGALWREICAHCQHHGAALHLIGLLSDGNVHSHIDHPLAMLARADAAGVRRAFVHVLLDGRDVERASAERYLARLEAALAAINLRRDRHYAIASGGGRMVVTMDRYGADWPMVARGWQLHVRGAGRQFDSAAAALAALRAEAPGIGDQDLPGFVIAAHGKAVGPIVDGDAVIAFNFRGDRMLELTEAFEAEEFVHFPRGPRPKVLFAGMTQYDGDLQRPRRFLVAPPEIACPLSELLAAAHVRQLACSETQKFGHVTYFWNGNRSGSFDPKLEHFIEVPSRPPPFDACPEMRAADIVAEVLKACASAAPPRLVRVNLANGDMVGHTGNFAATVAAVEAVDRALGALEAPVLARGGGLFVTADHGNAEDMVQCDPKTRQPLCDAAGRPVPKTSHSLNPVPFALVLPPALRGDWRLLPQPAAGLGHVAATLCSLLGFEPPQLFLPPLVGRA